MTKKISIINNNSCYTRNLVIKQSIPRSRQPPIVKTYQLRPIIILRSPNPNPNRRKIQHFLQFIVTNILKVKKFLTVIAYCYKTREKLCQFHPRVTVGGEWSSPMVKDHIFTCYCLFASNSNIEILQCFQSKTLRSPINAPWYVTNETIHHDLKIPTVKDEIYRSRSRYNARVNNHHNPLVTQLLDMTDQIRRLKRKSALD